MKIIASDRIAVRTVFGSGPTGGSRSDRGFTLVEMVASVGILVVVLGGAWVRLKTTNDKMNRIDFGGQASEANRSALAAFERDLGHSVLAPGGQSPVYVADSRTCALYCDVDNDGVAERVQWSTDATQNTLVRSVTNAAGDTTSTVELEGLATAAETPAAPLFTYFDSATAPSTSTGSIGLITIHLRNGMPTRTQNIVDRTASFRVIAYVINGY
jgi:prepilin-type N-terminal cleavage/methylation domain-containing protein